MNKLILIAGAAALAAPGMACAEPKSKGDDKTTAEAAAKPQTVRTANGRFARISSRVGVAPACPPGLAKKDCVPPGQTKLAAIGDVKND